MTIMTEENKPFSFESMGIKFEDALEIAKLQNSTRKKADGLICVCGHSSSRHELISAVGHTVCQPSVMTCPCKREKYVLKTSKIFHFVRKTKGNGTLHSLLMGAVASLEKGATLEWVGGGPICAFCGTKETNANIQPRCFTREGRAINSERSDGTFSAGYDDMCCEACWLEK